MGADFWSIIESSQIAEDLPGGTGAAAMPVMAAFTLDPGTYEFAIAPRGDDIQASNPDYYGTCVLTVTAYTGLGPMIDLAGG